MVYSQTLQLAPPRIRVELRRVLICLAAAAIALTGAALTAGNAYANQTYPAAVGHSIIADGALPVATPVPLPLGTRYLARKTVERIAKDDIGKLHGLRIGPFAPGATSRAMPLGWAEPLIGHPLPAGADRATSDAEPFRGYAMVRRIGAIGSVGAIGRFIAGDPRPGHGGWQMAPHRGSR